MTSFSVANTLKDRLVATVIQIGIKIFFMLISFDIESDTKYMLISSLNPFYGKIVNPYQLILPFFNNIISTSNEI